MSAYRFLPALAAALLSSTVLSPNVALAKDKTPNCPGLLNANVANTTITAAELITTGSFTPPGSTKAITGLPTFCRVSGVVSTQPTEAVQIELWLPEQAAWNSRFEALGDGGFAGSIGYSGLAAPLEAGYAAGTTDSGHEGGGSGSIGAVLAWAANPVSLYDWGHSSFHLLAVASKAIIKDYYGRSASFSYYQGCSTGGAEGMEEAQFYPDDFDGIWAGSAGQDYAHLMMSFMWGAVPAAQNPSAAIPTTVLKVLNQAVLTACASNKANPTDQFLNDPRSCHYDPAVLLCTAGQDPSTCLSPSQLTAVTNLYSPVHKPDGTKLYPGFVLGSEDQWGTILSGGFVSAYAQPLFANAVYDNPNWNWLSFNYDSDAALIDQQLSPKIDATNPDLSGLRKAGHKLIATQGWKDSFNAQTMPIDYFNSVVLTINNGEAAIEKGKSVDTTKLENSLTQVQDFYRLFMVPGMGHCGANAGGLTTFDTLTPLVNWVENGVAPKILPATGTPTPGVTISRNLCPYPQVIQYVEGDPTQAASYDCVSDQADYQTDIDREAENILQNKLNNDPYNAPN
jgi:feruloyl esterase